MVDALERERAARPYYDDDRFGETTPDVEWLKTLADDDPRWVIISGDGRILKNKGELNARKPGNSSRFGRNSWRTPRARRRGSTRFPAGPD
jgi:hypothetical protein